MNIHQIEFEGSLGPLVACEDQGAPLKRRREQVVVVIHPIIAVLFDLGHIVALVTNRAPVVVREQSMRWRDSLVDGRALPEEPFPS